MPPIEFDLPVYTFHIDFVGHVSNIVYIQWMEIGRTKLLQAAGLSVETLARAGLVPVLTYTEIEYREPLFLGDPVRLCAWISEARHASARLEFRFYKGNHGLAAKGAQRGLFVHRDTMRPARITPEMRAALANVYSPCEDHSALPLGGQREPPRVMPELPAEGFE